MIKELKVKVREMQSSVKIVVAAAGLFLAAACARGEGIDAEDGYGILDVGSITVAIEEEMATRAAAVDASGFIMRVLSGSEVVVDWNDISEHSGGYLLKKGNYTLEVSSPENPAAAWNSPVYVGSTAFEILPDATTLVGTAEAPVVCRLSNVKVTVRYDELLHALLDDETEVVVSMGGNSLVFDRNETRAGYFRAAAPATMIVNFSGTIGTKPVNLPTTIDNVEPGKCADIEFLFNRDDWTFTVSVSGRDGGQGSQIGQIVDGTPWF